MEKKRKEKTQGERETDGRMREGERYMKEIVKSRKKRED